MAVPNLGPAPEFPERPGTFYERKISPALPGQRGPLRFEEGVGTDTDVPQDFTTGVMQGLISAPGRPNRNQNVFEKYPEETMRERAHVGSAAWVESYNYLGEFAGGSFADYAEVKYDEVVRSGSRQQHVNPALVTD